MHQDNEVGFILHPYHWRKGIVTEAMRAIVPHIFAVTDVQTLTADTDPHNVASINCLKNLGFQVTHTAKNTSLINDVWYDSVDFSMPQPT